MDNIKNAQTKGHVSNPLTVIAIFAGLTETAGTVVLPLIQPANQVLYIYFLMAFPTVLVLVFFMTLNWNSKVLYAPSDFREDNSYLKIHTKNTATNLTFSMQATGAVGAKPAKEVTNG